MKRWLMATVETLGIKRIESVHYYVHDLARSRRFYTEVMDFAEIGGSSEEMTERGHEKSVAFMAGNCVVTCIAPRGDGGRAWRYLRKHPDGIGTLNFEVDDAKKAFDLESLPDNLQLTAYHYAYEMLFRESPKDLKLIQFIRTKQPKIETYITGRHQRDEEHRPPGEIFDPHRPGPSMMPTAVIPPLWAQGLCVGITNKGLP
jgi:catechol 2,3-dioxygenase-like lactoylglutathione lyase family enzyme